jgi:hypothetical protein
VQKAHIRQCDGLTPICSPCHSKSTQCTYSSDPNVSRFAALKSEYEQVKTSLDDLSTIYERLKQGSASEASRLLQRIRTEDGIPGFLEDNGSPRRSGGGLQLRDYNTWPDEEPQAGSHTWPGRKTALRPEPTLDIGAAPQRTGPIDTNLHKDSGNQDTSPLSPNVVWQTSSLDDFQKNANCQRNIRSHISVSHRVLLWPGVIYHMRRSGLAATAESDLQCILRNGSP